MGGDSGSNLKWSGESFRNEATSVAELGYEKLEKNVFLHGC